MSWAKETSGFDQYRKTCLIICGNTTLSQLKDIEPFMSGAEKNSRFCISCGELATKLVKYDTEGAIIIEKIAIDAQKRLKIARLINIELV